MSRHGDGNRVIVAYLVMVGVFLALFLTINITIQHVYCGTPISRCKMLEMVPCEPISKIEAERAEYQRLAEQYNMRTDK